MTNIHNENGENTELTILDSTVDSIKLATHEMRCTGRISTTQSNYNQVIYYTQIFLSSLKSAHVGAESAFL